ncbi:MAG: hypothetical protein U9R49_08295 [Bacteroidota bacterium]|nr:hypothetical protein [Bacteroidota bacterium]
MIKRYHIPAIAFFLFCTSIALLAQNSVYTFPFENSYKLPPMETFINVEEISSTYQTYGNLYTTEITGLSDETVEQTSSTYISDVKAIDAFRFLKFYMEEELVSPGDETHGSVEMSIIYFHEKGRVNIGTAINILTLGIGTLFGIPFATSITDVEVEASFFNDNKQFIAAHRGVGRGKKWIGLYNLDTRLPHQRALKEAISELNTKIMSDPKLRELNSQSAVPEP